MGEGTLLLRLRRAFAYLVLTLPLMPVQALLVATGSRFALRLPMIYHGLVCRLLGLRLTREGTPSRERPTLFIANHTSYLDIEVLGAAIEGSFVSKSEVAVYPFFGWLAKLQRTVFVDRQVRSTVGQRDAIQERLEQGDNLILFPEGTSSDGMRVLPFKSSLFSVAERAPNGVPLVVQPVTVAYTRLDGMPLGRFYRPFIAWYGDMGLGPHLWTMLGLGTVEVNVSFHAPVSLAQYGSRKTLAEHCHRVVATGLAAALAGRPPDEEEMLAASASAMAEAASAE
jgi:lyso-ornithine lipid O-acyltransferase